MRNVYGLGGLLIVALLAPFCPADFIVQWDESALQVGIVSTTRTVTIPLTITHVDTGGPSTFSSFTISMLKPSPGLTLSNPVLEDFQYQGGLFFSEQPTAFLFGVNPTTDYDVGVGETKALFAIDFTLAPTNENIPLNLNVISANRGSPFGSLTSIRSEISIPPNMSIKVTAVPEPSALCFVGLLTLHLLVRRHRTAFSARAELWLSMDVGDGRCFSSAHRVRA